VRTLVMGILNVTPDSFAGGTPDPGAAVDAALALIEAGADLIDIGAESTRPGASPVDEGEVWRRLEPALRARGPRAGVPISVDTYKARVAERALDLGAVIVNDVSALTYDAALAGVVARRGAAVVLMHTRGRSADMYGRATYDDVAADVRRELEARVEAAERAGIARDRIVVDPGIGFAKRAEQSYALLARLSTLSALGRPILSGPSRKSFLKQALGDVPPDERVWGTAAAVAASFLGGAHIVRVHDVRAMVQVARVADRIAAPGA
jgi:dihydropteroate synthase